MRYIYEGNKSRRVMHIQKFNKIGEGIMQALCNIDLPFNRSINTPFALGRKICSNCNRNLLND